MRRFRFRSKATVSISLEGDGFDFARRRPFRFRSKATVSISLEGDRYDPSMRRQYHFQPGSKPGRRHAWDVERLIALSAHLPVESVPVDTLTEVDSVYWFDGSLHKPTVRSVIEHLWLIEAVDSSYPIILGADGRVMDGMHRVARAILEGQDTIEARRFPVDPEPDHLDCQPEDLPYD